MGATSTAGLGSGHLGETTADHPHCDELVLHAPGSCHYCDKYPDRQVARDRALVNFTGESHPMKLPCPSIARRPLETIERWPGNVAAATATADETTETYEYQQDEFISGPACGPHDFHVLPKDTAGGVRQLYCRGALACRSVPYHSPSRRLALAISSTPPQPVFLIQQAIVKRGKAARGMTDSTAAGRD